MNGQRFFRWSWKTVNDSHSSDVLVKMHKFKWWVRDGTLDELILAVSWHAISIQTRYILCVDFVYQFFICCLQVKQGMEQNISNATSLHTMWCYYQTHSLFLLQALKNKQKCFSICCFKRWYYHWFSVQYMPSVCKKNASYTPYLIPSKQDVDLLCWNLIDSLDSVSPLVVVFFSGCKFGNILSVII